MLFINKRIQVICDELKKLVVVKTFPVEHIKYKKGRYYYIEEAENGKEPWNDFNQGEAKWYGPDGHYWFRGDYTIPKELKGQTLRLQVKTQIEEWDDGKNPQFLFFLDGEVTQGLDMKHRTVQLTDKAVPGQTMHLISRHTQEPCIRNLK